MREDVILKSLLNELMLSIPGGTVSMRDDRRNEQWTTVVDSFLLSKFQVTQQLYNKVVNKTPSAFRGAALPVETVSWKETVLFCNKLSEIFDLQVCYTLGEDQDSITFNTEANGYRLPTEAEWQFACQAGTTQIRYGELNEIAWYKENAEGKTHEVGKKKPNAFGLYDMLGNVWEWCSDIYDEEVYGAYRVFRGGGWCDVERSVMATTRRRSHPRSFKIDDLGFRIARNK